MSQYFPKPYERSDGNVKVELALSNYMKNADLKGATSADRFNLTAESDLASLNDEVDKVNIDKLKTVPADASKLNNVGDNDVVKKTVYDKLVTTINAIYTSGFVLKTQ